MFVLKDDEYPYLVLDTFSRRFKSEPVAGYFRTRQAAQDNAARRNSQLNDPYGMKRYIVFDTQEEGT
jgi:hypothetical protein